MTSYSFVSSLINSVLATRESTGQTTCKRGRSPTSQVEEERAEPMSKKRRTRQNQTEEELANVRAERRRSLRARARDGPVGEPVDAPGNVPVHAPVDESVDEPVSAAVDTRSNDLVQEPVKAPVDGAPKEPVNGALKEPSSIDGDDSTDDSSVLSSCRSPSILSSYKSPSVLTDDASQDGANAAAHTQSPPSRACQWEEAESTTFKAQVEQELADIVAKVDARLRQHATALSILTILHSATLPSTNRPGAALAALTSDTPTDALLASKAEFAQLVQPGNVYRGPIFSSEPLGPLQFAGHDPIDDFLKHRLPRSKVHIQDSQMPKDKSSVDTMTLEALRKRLAAKSPSTFPINCLDLSAPRDHHIRPRAFDNDDCGFLNDVIQSQQQSAGREMSEALKVDVRLWVLLAERGSLTDAHMDSHGFGTFITVNHGKMGFAWLSKPSILQLEEWVTGEYTSAPCKWCYAVMTPGQTVYFPPGTLHCVFRSRLEDNTLATGGHILRQCTIDSWAEICHFQQRHPEITNEAVDDIPYQVAAVARLVKSSNDLTRWGGEQVVTRFHQIAKQIQRESSKSRRKRR